MKTAKEMNNLSKLNTKREIEAFSTSGLCKKIEEQIERVANKGKYKTSLKFYERGLKRVNCSVDTVTLFLKTKGYSCLCDTGYVFGIKYYTLYINWWVAL